MHGLNRFGLPEPGKAVLAYFGFPVGNVVRTAYSALAGNPEGIEKKQVPSSACRVRSLTHLFFIS